jgi:DNA-binding transcriptional ArsR family regulator
MSTEKRLTTQAQKQRRETLRLHPRRDGIIDAMRTVGEPISPTRLARVTGYPLGSTAYHVRVLEKAGVVELADEGRARGAVEHFYALVDEHAAEVSDPLVGLQTVCGALTQETQDGGYPKAVALDREARVELQKILDSIRPKVARIVSRAATRAHD